MHSMPCSEARGAIRIDEDVSLPLAPTCAQRMLGGHMHARKEAAVWDVEKGSFGEFGVFILFLPLQD